MTPHPTRRRALLLLAAAGLATATLPAWLGRPGRRRLAGSLVSLFKHEESARVVGRLYLARRPDEADPDRLVGRLARDLGIAPWGIAPWPAPDRSLPMLRARIRRRAAAERTQRQTLVISGHDMSLTELRLCALAALSA